MTFYIIGLGNPEPEYAGTRHNIGRDVLEQLREKGDFSEWEHRKEHAARVSRGSIAKHDVVLVEPDNYMNNSGQSLRKIFDEDFAIENMTVVQDDIDRAIGDMHVGFNRGAGGHRGVQSIIDTLKTKRFNRVRLGIAPLTFFGKMRKPKGVQAVQRYVVGKFSRREADKVKPAIEKAADACVSIITAGVSDTMNSFN